MGRCSRRRRGPFDLGRSVLDYNGYAPTVLFNPPIDSNVMQKEVFGPVIAVYAYDDLADAI